MQSCWGRESREHQGSPRLARSLVPPGSFPRLPGVCRFSQAFQICLYPHLTVLRNAGYFL